jgi:hypothetical protein
MGNEVHSGDQWGAPIPGSRPTIQTDRKGWARDQVRRAATQGKGPTSYRADDLEWAFGTSPEAVAELARLEQQAETVKAAKAESERKLRASGRVLAVAERILKEADERRDRRRKAAAIAEARRRLGLPPIE